MSTVNEFKLEVFLSGETVDICIPDENFARRSDWYKWFNSLRTTRFLEQGLIPNSAEKQVEFYRSLQNSSDRVSFIISDKTNYIGTISLSSLNLYKRTADVAMLLGEKSDKENADLMALESMALITEYGFAKLGLKRISAGQHEKLISWQRKLELLGYRLEGYKTNGFIKGAEEANAVIIAVTPKDYDAIKNKRSSFWDGCEKMRARLEILPEIPFAAKMKALFKEEGEEYYQVIFNL